MSLIFTPNGSLDIATDPSDLPETAAGHDILSGAMVRCKNLRTNEAGKAKTRDGSAKLHATAIASPVWWLEVQSGARYAFAGTRIYENEDSIAEGLTSARWAAIQYNAFNDPTPNIFALNGTDRKRIEDGAVLEWGLEAPEDEPTLSVAAGSALTGDYNARYTYVRKVDSVVVAESNPSPAASAAQTLSSQNLGVSVTAPTDDQVTHIRLYRSIAGGEEYFFDQDIAIGSTSFISSEADADLGDLLEEDHDRPPLGTYVFGPAYDGTCFILKDNLLYYCKAKQPEYWPALYFIEVSTPQFPLQTGVFHNGQTYVLSKIEIFYVQGTGPGVFNPLPMRAKTGAQSARGAVAVAGKGIFHTGPDGIYLFSSGTDVRTTEATLEPIFRGEDTQGIPGVSDMSTSWLHVHKNHLYFGYQSAGYDYPTNVLVLNLETGRLVYYIYNDGSDVEIVSIATDHTNSRLLIGDANGYVRVIESAAHTADDDEQIAFEVQSKDFMLSTRKHFPRWTKYDVDASNAESCVGSFILEGAVHQQHTITGSRNTRRRLIGTGNGNRAAIRISGTGPVTIYAAESE